MAAPFHSSFALKAQLLIKSFERVPMSATPNTTIKSVATVTDANGSLVSNLSVCNVTVTFPDGSTQTFNLAGGVTNTGSGTYTISYKTKAEGQVVEDWSTVDSSGLVFGEFHNTYGVTF